MTASVALIGGRGFVGEAFLRLIRDHPELELAWASSRSLAGRAIDAVYPDLPWSFEFESITPEMLAGREADVIVLALPNQMAGSYVDRLGAEQRVVDLSADYRFDEEWVYGLPEINRKHLRGAIRVSNPGCYATAMQLALTPLVNEFSSPPVAFGVSGYSGAGRTRSARTEPDRLRNNLQPYSLTGHLHEHEVSHRLGQKIGFLPHVAEFFRGISITVSGCLKQETSASKLLETFQTYYAEEALVRISADIPEVRDVTESPAAIIGGFAVDKRDGRRICLVACVDNLMKGAASQAMQNINLMLNLDEVSGLVRVQE